MVAWYMRLNPLIAAIIFMELFDILFYHKYEAKMSADNVLS